MSPATQKGYTLAELMIVVLVIGAVSAVIANQLRLLNTGASAQYRNGQIQVNDGIAQAFRAFAQDNSGDLPAPYTDGSFNKAVADPDNDALRQRLVDAGTPPGQINDDGRAAEKVRVYQRIEDISKQVSLLGHGDAPPQVDLTYDFGVIYSTDCRRNDGGCNSDVPGGSDPITASNRGTWQTDGDDYGAVRISTLNLQQERVADSGDRIIRVRDKIRDYYEAVSLSKPPSNTDNSFPAPNETNAPDLSGGIPTGNQGCYDGWYDLSDTNVNVLSQIGLAKNQYAETVFGGAIEYCRDYDPSANGEGTVPHSAALRVKRAISDGNDPSSPSENVVVTF